MPPCYVWPRKGAFICFSFCYVSSFVFFLSTSQADNKSVISLATKRGHLSFCFRLHSSFFSQLVGKSRMLLFFFFPPSHHGGVPWQRVYDVERPKTPEGLGNINDDVFRCISKCIQEQMCILTCGIPNNPLFRRTEKNNCQRPFCKTMRRASKPHNAHKGQPPQTSTK